MVNGVAALHAKFAAVPELVREEVTKAIAKVCDEIVRDMKALAPVPEMVPAIDWAWGDAPSGAMKVATFKGKEYARVAATIYVRKDPAFYAHWFEFGTNLRVQKTTGRKVGKIKAQPFFWPAVRAGKRTFNSRIRAAVNRAMKRANGT